MLIKDKNFVVCRRDCH